MGARLQAGALRPPTGAGRRGARAAADRVDRVVRGGGHLELDRAPLGVAHEALLDAEPFRVLDRDREALALRVRRRELGLRAPELALARLELDARALRLRLRRRGLGPGVGYLTLCLELPSL